MTSCEDVLDLLPEVLPRLTPHAIAVHEHLRSCVECGEAAEELTRVLHALETEGEPTPALSEGFADRVVDALPAKSGFLTRILPATAFGRVALIGHVAALALAVVGVRLYVDGILIQHRTNTDTVDGYVAARDLKPGQVIGINDVVESQFERAVLESYKSSRITDRTTIIGARVTAPVEAGQVLQTYHFRNPMNWQADAQLPNVVVYGPGSSFPDHTAPAPPRTPRPPREAVTATAPAAPSGPPSIQIAGGPARRASPASAARYYAAAEASGAGTTLVRYVTDAGLVLEAVAVLDEPDPHWLRVLARRVDEADLLERGERLLIELRRDPEQGELRPLISATQLVLRKVRHAPAEEPELALVSLRREMSSTGLLEAYRTLLAPAETQPAPPTARGGPF
jgi:hypothetical protein